MSNDVQFNEPGYEYNYVPNTGRDSLIYRLVYKTGLAKDKAGADKVLIGLAVVAIIVAIYFFSTNGAPKEVPVTPPDASTVTQ